MNKINLKNLLNIRFVWLNQKAEINSKSYWHSDSTNNARLNFISNGTSISKEKLTKFIVKNSSNKIKTINYNQKRVENTFDHENVKAHEDDLLSTSSLVKKRIKSK